MSSAKPRSMTRQIAFFAHGTAVHHRCSDELVFKQHSSPPSSRRARDRRTAIVADFLRVVYKKPKDLSATPSASPDARPIDLSQARRRRRSNSCSDCPSLYDDFGAEDIEAITICLVHCLRRSGARTAHWPTEGPPVSARGRGGGLASDHPRVARMRAPLTRLWSEPMFGPSPKAIMEACGAASRGPGRPKPAPTSCSLATTSTHSGPPPSGCRGPS